MRRRTIAALLVALALTVAACSDPGTGDTGGNGGAAIGPFDGVSITVQAIGLQMEPNSITMPSGKPLRIILDNQDTGVPHDIRVFQGDTEFGKSAVVFGPGLTEVRFGPLKPARYTFACSIHPAMAGTLLITP